MRVELVKMDDPYTRLSPGDQGRIDFVDDSGGIHIRWDNGEGHTVILEQDAIRAASSQRMCCLDCGHEFEGAASLDFLGWHSVCPECYGSFDVDIV
jgi:hypothetical protein